MTEATQRFSLNDADIVKITQMAQVSDDPTFLRKSLYAMIRLRKELATQLNITSSSLRDYQRIVDNTTQALAQEHSKGLGMLFDRGGITKLRSELQRQIELNVQMAKALQQQRESSNQQMTQEISRISNALQSANQQISALEQARIEQATALEKARSSLVSAEAQHASLLDNQTLLQNEIEALRERETNLLREIDDLHNASVADPSADPAVTEALNEQLAHAQQQIAELQSQISSLQEQLAAASSQPAPQPLGAEPDMGDLSAWQQQHEEVLVEKMRLERGLAEARTEVTVAAQRITELEQNLDSTSSQLDQARSSLAINKTSLQIETDKSRALATQVKQLQSELQAVTERTGTVSHEATGLRVALDETETELAGARERIGELERRNRELVAEVNTLASANAKIGDLHQKIQELNERNSELENVVNISTQQTENLIKQVDLNDRQYAEQLTAARSQITDLQQKLQATTHRAVQAEQRTERLMAGIRTMSKDRYQIRKERNEAFIELREVTLQNRQLLQSHGLLGQQNTNLIDQLKNAQKVIRLEQPATQKVERSPEIELENTSLTDFRQ